MPWNSVHCHRNVIPKAAAYSPMTRRSCSPPAWPPRFLIPDVRRLPTGRTRHPSIIVMIRRDTVNIYLHSFCMNGPLRRVKRPLRSEIVGNLNVW
jgi:hypothetical protein